MKEITSREETTDGVPKELSLQAVDHAVKSTVIGYLLPIQVTVMTHDNLKELSIAEALMSHLVRLVFLASQVSAVCLNKMNYFHDGPGKSVCVISSF